MTEHGTALDPERENEVPELRDPNSPALTRRQLRQIERETGPIAAAAGQPALSGPETAAVVAAPMDAFFNGPLPSPVQGGRRLRPRGRRRSAGARTAFLAGPSRKSLASSAFSALVMTVVAGLAAVSILPATAGTPADVASLAVSSSELTSAKAGTQALDESSSVAAPAVSRDGYSAAAAVPSGRNRWAGATGAYTNNPNGSIQWPFAATVPITSGFGPRVAPCAWCSSNHLGVDFTPGEGYPIQSIGPGVVREVINNRWGLGYHVIIDYPTLGISALYAHMQVNPNPLVAGQSVVVGEGVGLVGHTGTVTAPHLHFEIWDDGGTPIDPYAWLKANAN